MIVRHCCCAEKCVSALVRNKPEARASVDLFFFFCTGKSPSCLSRTVLVARETGCLVLVELVQYMSPGPAYIVSLLRRMAYSGIGFCIV